MANLDLLINIRETGIENLSRIRNELQSFAANQPRFNLNVNTDQLRQQLAGVQAQMAAVFSGGVGGNVAGSSIAQLRTQAESLKRQLDAADSSQRKLNNTAKGNGATATGARKAAQETGKLATALRQGASAAALIDGPLGGVASRFSVLSTVLTNFNPTAFGAVLGFAAIGREITRGVAAAGKFEEQFQRIQNVVRATGGSAGRSAGQVNELAQQLALDTLASTEGARDAAGILLTFRSITGDTFDRTLKVAQDLSAVFGQNLSSSATQLGKALQDPIAGIGALSRVGVSFTNQQKEQIKVLTETGDVLTAQALILEEIERQVGGAADASNTYAGAVDTLSEEYNRFLENLGNQGPLEAATAFLESLGTGVGVLADLLEETAPEAFLDSVATRIEEINQQLANTQIGFTALNQLLAERDQLQTASNFVEDNNRVFEEREEIEKRILAVQERQADVVRQNIQELRSLTSENFTGLGNEEIASALNRNSTARNFVDSQLQQEDLNSSGAGNTIGPVTADRVQTVSSEIEQLESDLERLGETYERVFTEEAGLVAGFLSNTVQTANEQITESIESAQAEIDRINVGGGGLQVISEADRNASIEELNNVIAEFERRRAEISSLQNGADIRNQEDVQAEIQSLGSGTSGSLEAATNLIAAREKIQIESAQKVAEFEIKQSDEALDRKLANLERESASVEEIFRVREQFLDAEISKQQLAASTSIEQIRGQIEAQERVDAARRSNAAESGTVFQDSGRAAQLQGELTLALAEQTELLEESTERQRALTAEKLTALSVERQSLLQLRSRLAELRGQESEVIAIEFEVMREQLIEEIRGLNVSADIQQALTDQLDLQEAFEIQLSQVEGLGESFSLGQLNIDDFQAQSSIALAELENLARATGNVGNIQQALELDESVKSDIRDVAAELSSLQADLLRLQGNEIGADALDQQQARIAQESALRRSLAQSGLSQDQQDAQVTEIIDTQKISDDLDLVESRIERVFALFNSNRITEAEFTAQLTGDEQLIDRFNELATELGNSDRIALGIEFSRDAILDSLAQKLEEIQLALDSGEIGNLQASLLVNEARDEASALQGQEGLEGDDRLTREIDRAGQNLDAIGQIRDQAAGDFADGFSNAFGQFITGAASAEQAFASFASSFLANIAQMIARALILQAIESAFGGGGSIASAVNHSGGIVGRNGASRRVPEHLFRYAPRLHSGGTIGPGEVPTILQVGEEVLARDNPRNSLNGGGQSGDVQVNNFLDRDSLAANIVESDQFKRAVNVAIQSNREQIGARQF